MLEDSCDFVENEAMLVAILPSYCNQKIENLNDGMICLHEIMLDPSKKVQYSLSKESLDHRTEWDSELREYFRKGFEDQSIHSAQKARVVRVDTDEQADTGSYEEVDNEKEGYDLHEVNPMIRL